MPDSTDQPTDEAELSAKEGAEESDAEHDASKVDVDGENAVDGVDGERMARDTAEMPRDERPGAAESVDSEGDADEASEDRDDEGEADAESPSAGDPEAEADGKGDSETPGSNGDAAETAQEEASEEADETPEEEDSSGEELSEEVGAAEQDEEAIDRSEDEEGEVYETVQMAAIDRRAIEREGQVRQLEQTLPLLSSRFAPEIVVSPPRVLVQDWQEGLPEREGEEAPDVEEQPAGREDHDGQEEHGGQEEAAGPESEDIPPEAFETQPSSPPEPVQEEREDEEETGEDETPPAGTVPPDVDEPEGTSRKQRATPPARPKPGSTPPETPDEEESEEDPPEKGVRGPRETPAMPSDVLDDAADEASSGGRERGRRDTVPVEEGQDPAPTPGTRDVGEIDGELAGEAAAEPAGPQPMNYAADEGSPRSDGTWVRQVFGELYLATVTGDIDALTEREADFIEESLELDESGRVLDLACGWGRHTMELTDRGYDSLGFDLSKPLLERGLKEAKHRSLDVNYYHGDMRALEFDGEFDACFCWQTSFGYFDDQTNFDILRRVYRALEPGGTFLIDVMNRDFVIDDMPHRIWWEGRECLFLEEGDFDFATSTMHVNRSFIYEDGRPPIEQDWYIRLYSPHELQALLRQAGFRVEELSGDLHYRGYFIGEDSPRMIVKAVKDGSAD